MGMSESTPSKPPVPAEGPEAPDLFKVAMWVWHHLAKEGKVIRTAPLSFLVVAAVAGCLVWIASQWTSSQETKIKDATIENLVAQIQSLSAQVTEYKSKLQVSSPDEAAKKIADLENRLKPILSQLDRPQRVLTEEQKGRLVKYGAPIKAQLTDTWIWIAASDDAESQRFATDILHAIHTAGLRAAYLGSSPLEPGDHDIAIKLLDPDHPTANAKAVMDLLAKSGISYSVELDTADYPNPPDMEITVTPPKS